MKDETSNQCTPLHAYASMPGDEDPKKSKRKVPPVDADNAQVLNENDQDDVLNSTGQGYVESDEAAEKGKGYAEGTKNDNLTEPEYRDSDDQPTFPGDETIT